MKRLLLILLIAGLLLPLSFAQPATENFDPSREYTFDQENGTIWQFFSEHDKWYVWHINQSIPQDLIVTDAQLQDLLAQPPTIIDLLIQYWIFVAMGAIILSLILYLVLVPIKKKGKRK